MTSGDDEQYDGRAFLGDTSTGSGPSHQGCTTKRKIILALLIAVVILVGVISIVVTHMNKSTASDSKTDKIIGDPVKPIPVCVYNGTDIIDDPKPEKCSPDSKYVKDKCRENALHPDCQYCDENAKTRILLPKSCFCHKFDQCPNGKDQRKKQMCSTCLQAYFCPCLPHGTCTCGKNTINKTGKDLRCICNPGYGGFYCNYVPKRLCSYPNKTTGSLPDCYQSTADKCFITDTVRNATLECVIFKEKNIPSGLGKCVTIKEKRQE